MKAQNICYMADGTNFVIDTKGDVQQRKSKEIYLRSLNIKELSKNPMWTVSNLRKLCVGFVSTRKDGKILGKMALIENITAYILESRESVKQSLVEFLDDSNLSESLPDDFFLALENGTDLEDLKVWVLSQLSHKHRTEISMVKTGIPNFLKALQMHPGYLKNQAQIQKVKSLLYTAKKDSLVEINQEYKEKVKEQQTTLSDLKCKPVIEWAVNVLERLDNWKDVTYAIALMTGRRMAEILGSHGVYELEETELHFTGVLKGKGRDVEGESLINTRFKTFPICNPELIIKGIEYLTNDGRRNEDVDKINKVYASIFSNRATREMMRVRKESGLDGQFKTARDFYATYQADKVFKQSEQTCTQMVFVMNRLHQAEMGATDSYRKFRIVD